MAGGGGGATKTSPWSGAAPHLMNINEDAKKVYNQETGNYWKGDFIAPQSDWSKQALNMGAGVATGWQNAGAGVKSEAQKVLSGLYLDPSQNTALQGAIRAAQRPVVDTFNRQVLPGMQSQAIAAGAYGGDANAINTALSGSELSKNLANTSAAMTYQNYADERARMDRAGSQLQQAQALDLFAPQTLAAMGQASEGYSQQAIQNAQQKQFAEANAQWENLQRYLSMVNGSGQYTTTTTGGGGSSPAAGAAGGAILGGLAGNQLAGMWGSQGGGGGGNPAAGAAAGAASGAAAGSVVPGWGTAIGAVLGGLSGYLGSR